MPSNKPQFIYRTDKEILNKLKEIAEKENRTANKQLDHIVKKFIEEYEMQQNRTEQKSKLEQSSISRTG